MKKLIFTALTGAFLITSCKTPDIVLSDQLKENTSVYEVKGRQGWQFNQVIKYGDYSTSKVKRGWSMGYNFPFIIRFKGASEKLSYQQNTPFGKTAEVFCVGKFKSTDIPAVVDFFSFPIDRSVSLKYEDYFAGSIKNDQLNWNFILYNPDNNSPLTKDARYRGTSGEIVNSKNNERIVIKPVYKVKGQFYPKGFDKLNLYGFEFFENEKSIGAVSLVNNGRVWFNKDLSEDKKLVLSSVMTGLMVRHSMSEGFSE